MCRCRRLLLCRQSSSALRMVIVSHRVYIINKTVHDVLISQSAPVEKWKKPVVDNFYDRKFLISFHCEYWAPFVLQLLFLYVYIMYICIYNFYICCCLIAIQKPFISGKKPVPRLIYVLFHLSIEIFAHYFIHITHFMWCVLLKFTHTFAHSHSVCILFLFEFTCRIFFFWEFGSYWMSVSANEWRRARACTANWSSENQWEWSLECKTLSKPITSIKRKVWLIQSEMKTRHYTVLWSSRRIQLPLCINLSINCRFYC